MTARHTQPALLKLLSAHPLLSARQIEVYWRRSRRAVQTQLRQLKRAGLIAQYNARRDDTYARALYAPTDSARQAELTPPAPARLARLLLLGERVFKTRTVLIWLARDDTADWDWRLRDWEVEAALTFDATRWRAHGVAHMARADGAWVTLVIEYDTRATPNITTTERARLAHWVAAQVDQRFLGPGRLAEFPALAIVAQDELRLQDYYAALRGAALARGLPMPPVYLTTRDRAWELRAHPAAPIWYSTRANRDRVPLLSDAVGNPPPLPSDPFWRPLPLTGADEGSPHNPLAATLAPLAENAPPNFTTATGLAALALSLTPQDKRILDDVARHPLLAADEIALLSQLSPWYVTARLTRLVNWNLIEARRADTAEPNENPTGPDRGRPRQDARAARFVVSANGTRYLAATAGFDGAVRGYARARGWGAGVDVLTQHWEHTREENALLLQFARIARARGHTLTWLSELESRLYYDAGRDKRGQRGKRGAPCSFLPDGRGTYSADTRYDFAIEIDRTRAASAKLRRKLAAYYAVVGANILRGVGAALLRVLIVTSSWERVETLRNVAATVARELNAERDPLPLWITTFDLLRVKRADAPIWLRVDAAVLASPLARAQDVPKVYCFECFAPPPPPPPREFIGPPRYVSFPV